MTQTDIEPENRDSLNRRKRGVWRIALFCVVGIAGAGGVAIALDHYIVTHIHRAGAEQRLVFRLEAPYGSIELRPGTTPNDVATIETLAADVDAHNFQSSYKVNGNSTGLLRIGIGTDEGMLTGPSIAMSYVKSGFVPARTLIQSDMGTLMSHSPFSIQSQPIVPHFAYWNDRSYASHGYFTRTSTDAGTSIVAASPVETRIHLTKSLPIDFSANLGFGESTLDLSGLSLTNAAIETGASEAYIFCNQPNPQTLHSCSVGAGIGCTFNGISNLNADRFAFSGAVGTYHLGFDGHLTHNLDADVEIGLAICTITIPPTAARVQVFYEKGLFSSFSFSGLVNRREGYETSAGFDQSTSPILTIHLSSGAGKMSVSYH